MENLECLKGTKIAIIKPPQATIEQIKKSGISYKGNFPNT